MDKFSLAVTIQATSRTLQETVDPTEDVSINEVDGAVAIMPEDGDGGAITARAPSEELDGISAGHTADDSIIFMPGTVTCPLKYMQKSKTRRASRESPLPLYEGVGLFSSVATSGESCFACVYYLSKNVRAARRTHSVIGCTRLWERDLSLIGFCMQRNVLYWLNCHPVLSGGVILSLSFRRKTIDSLQISAQTTVRYSKLETKLPAKLRICTQALVCELRSYMLVASGAISLARAARVRGLSDEFISVFLGSLRPLSSSQRAGFDSRWGRPRISACGNRAGRCRLSGFLGDLPFPPHLHSGAAPYSPRFTVNGSQDFDEGKSYMETCSEAKRDWAAMACTLGAMTTTLSVLRASLNYEEQGKNRQERRKKPCDREYNAKLRSEENYRRWVIIRPLAMDDTPAPADVIVIRYSTSLPVEARRAYSRNANTPIAKSVRSRNRWGDYQPHNVTEDGLRRTMATVGTSSSSWLSGTSSLVGVEERTDILPVVWLVYIMLPRPHYSSGRDLAMAPFSEAVLLPGYSSASYKLSLTKTGELHQRDKAPDSLHHRVLMSTEAEQQLVPRATAAHASRMASPYSYVATHALAGRAASRDSSAACSQ
ncbi:hypothetical protein PR048_018427 [Dryococelus australis]|uniref:Uncharacterized protein n=1 Tax=Dryococelus australis TaxID=614101 RepID=A0ABQ9HC77_9NEOP|nr:hypothetical protein PR048_018427 [Dryococelus australis]